MVKHIHDNHGFTLIEMIFTISIIIILSTITLIHSIKHKPITSLTQQSYNVYSFLEEAKTKAILTHEKVLIMINHNYLQYINNEQERTLFLPSPFYFNNKFELSFNANGNINKANHLELCDKENCKSIIFNLGSGTFYVK